MTTSDDDYKKATKEIVDDNFRDDVLGPKICSVLTNHTPASDKIRSLIAEAILKEPACKNAIEAVVADIDMKRKSKWIDRFLGGAGGIIITVIGGLIIFLITKHVRGN